MPVVRRTGGVIIHLVGPGGAGKSTMGAALAARLGLTFLDLDAEFMKRVGDISQMIDNEGYEAYARGNVQTYISIADSNGSSVIALSSGFMTYPDGIHPQYARIRSEIAHSHSTFVLIPSLDFETCVRETVRRQLTRPFVHSSEKEEAVIRDRYGIYMAVPAIKVETMGTLDQVVDQIVADLPPNNGIDRIRASEFLKVP